MIKDCPFCGGKGVWQENSGSYGYYPATIWIACENSVFPKDTCAVRTRKQQWDDGRWYIKYEKAKSLALEQWNTRV